jgi:hypothetical protein
VAAARKATRGQVLVETAERRDVTIMFELIRREELTNVLTPKRSLGGGWQ